MLRYNDIAGVLTSTQSLTIFAPPFLSSTFTLCFEDDNDKYHEVKTKDFYINSSEGFYNISGEYISVVKYREQQDNQTKTTKLFSGGYRQSGNYVESWSCHLCDGNETTGCLWNDPTECLRL